MSGDPDDMMEIAARHRSSPTFVRYSAIEDAEPLRKEWDDFIEKETGDVFLTYDWCRVWWRHYGNRREPLIYVFRDGGEICGILPMFRERIRLGPVSTTVVKLMCSDSSPVTLPFPVRRDHLKSVVPIFLDELRKAVQWDLLYLGAICGRYPDYEDLLEEILAYQGEKLSVDARQIDQQIYYRLQESWERHVETLSHGQKKNVRRVCKDILKRGTKLETRFPDPENLAAHFDRFVSIHQAHWQEKGMPGHFREWPSAYEYHREMASAQLPLGRLRLMEVLLDGNCIGYEYMYRAGDTYLSFLNGRNGIDPGGKIDYRIFFREKIKLSVSEGARWIDSMRGNYDYKLLLGGELFPVRAIFISREDFLHRAKVEVFRSSAWVLDAWYSKIWRRRIAPRVGLKPGAFLGLWVRSHMLAK
ncbi:MAG: glycosyl transferase [Actinobacteria bacterium]|nr:glycosyl transferase [Actinomycetota bacterium]